MSRTTLPPPSLWQTRLGSSIAAPAPAVFETVPYGLVPGDMLTPTAAAAVAEVESGFKGAARVAAMRAVRGASDGTAAAGASADEAGGDGSGDGGRSSDVQV